MQYIKLVGISQVNLHELAYEPILLRVTHVCSGNWRAMTISQCSARFYYLHSGSIIISKAYNYFYKTVHVCRIDPHLKGGCALIQDSSHAAAIKSNRKFLLVSNRVTRRGCEKKSPKV
jgi:hypothetical protein